MRKKTLLSFTKNRPRRNLLKCVKSSIRKFLKLSNNLVKPAKKFLSKPVLLHFNNHFLS